MGKKKNKDKYNFERRRAIKCKFIEKSKTSPGYLKYEVTICEKDGTKHKQPAYGVDMQSAIARLVNQERTVKVENQITKYPFIAFAAWILLMSWPLLVGITYNTPQMLLYSFGGIIILTIIGGLWSNYINKK
jgi:hypothetical protein